MKITPSAMGQSDDTSRSAGGKLRLPSAILQRRGRNPAGFSRPSSGDFNSNSANSPAQFLHSQNDGVNTHLNQQFIKPRSFFGDDNKKGKNNDGSAAADQGGEDKQKCFLTLKHYPLHSILYILSYRRRWRSWLRSQMRRRPLRVSMSSTAPMCLQPPAISLARPPVAMVLVSGPSSPMRRSNIPSTRPI